MDLFFWKNTVPIPRYKEHSELDNYSFLTEKLTGKGGGMSRIDFSGIPKSALPTEDEYIILFPTTLDPRRSWGIERFRELIGKLLPEFSGSIVIAGVRNDYETGEILASVDRTRVVNYCGKTTLSELFDITLHAKLAISNDSGGGNIATVCGTPLIAAMGEAHYRFMNVPEKYKKVGLSVPVRCYQRETCRYKNCNWHCQYELVDNRFPCIDHIKLEDFFDKIQEILKSV
jgi:ADP-heptose:LPS heptosyltransferase